jgi:hypothetical protein
MHPSPHVVYADPPGPSRLLTRDLRFGAGLTMSVLLVWVPCNNAGMQCQSCSVPVLQLHCSRGQRGGGQRKCLYDFQPASLLLIH